MKVLISFLFVVLQLFAIEAFSEVRCDRVYEFKIENLNLPRELRVNDPLLIKALLRGPHSSLLKSIEQLLISLKIDNVLDQIAYSFRNHVYEKTPFKTEKEREDFTKELEDIVVVSNIRAEVVVKVWNIFEAIRTNVNRGHLARSERLLLSYVLKDFVDLSRFTLDDSQVFNHLLESSIQKVSQRAAPILTNGRLKKFFETLLKDRGFVNFLATRNDVSPDFGNEPIIEFIKRSASQHGFRLKNDANSMRIIAFANATINAFAELYYLRNVYENKNLVLGNLKESPYRELLDRSKEDLISVTEQMLYAFNINPRLVPELLNINELIIYDVPRPINRPKLETAIIDGVRNFLLGPKNLAEASLDRNHTPRSTVKSVSTWTFVESAPADMFAPKPQRKAGKTKSRGRKVEETSSQETKKEDAPPALTESELPVAGKEYSFMMLRQNGNKVYTIRFEEEALAPFIGNSAEPFTPFAKAIQYGFTDRGGHNGVKRVKGNKNIHSLYEVKPGNSNYRILMKREGDRWTAFKTLEKDNIVRYLLEYHQ